MYSVKVRGAALSLAIAGIGLVGHSTPAAAQAVAVSTYVPNVANAEGLAFDPGGNLFIATFDGRFLRVPPGGGSFSQVGSSPGNSPLDGLARAQNGDFFAAAPVGGVYRITPAGAFTLFSSAVNNPEAVAVGPNGVLYVSGVSQNSTAGQIYSVDGSGNATLLIDNIPGSVFGLTVDNTNTLYYTNEGDQNVYRRTPGGIVSVYGTVPASSAGNRGLAFGDKGELYVANFYDGEILVIPPGGGSATVFTQDVAPPLWLTFNNQHLFSSSSYSSEVDETTVYSPVPTMSEWALALFALSLGAAALFWPVRRTSVRRRGFGVRGHRPGPPSQGHS